MSTDRQSETSDQTVNTSEQTISSKSRSHSKKRWWKKERSEKITCAFICCCRVKDGGNT